MTDTTENTAFVLGDGAAKPKGFLDLPAWQTPGLYERNALERINSGVDGQVTLDGIIRYQNTKIGSVTLCSQREG